ncbi:MAG: ABC transporter permease, partial [Thermoplasmata archaeon]|nr:ABC transporter permease [Thermoplasmata archaeon]
MNPTIFLLSAARAMVPITLAAIGEIVTERAGVVNIGLEGILLLSGLFSAVVSLATNSIFLGVLTGVFVGLAIGALHALISVTLRGNQIVSGVGINTFALGFVVVVLISLYGS